MLDTALHVIPSGFSLHVRRGMRGSWVCRMSKSLVGATTTPAQFGNQVAALAEALGGVYHGWSFLAERD